MCSPAPAWDVLIQELTDGDPFYDNTEWVLYERVFDRLYLQCLVADLREDGYIVKVEPVNRR